MTLPVVGPVCAMLRTKTSFGGYVLDEDDQSDWQQGTSSTAVYWCLKTMDMAGPDDDFVDPRCCRAGRTCYRADE
jgi:hypothetical protein